MLICRANIKLCSRIGVDVSDIVHDLLPLGSRQQPGQAAPTRKLRKSPRLRDPGQATRRTKQLLRRPDQPTSRTKSRR